MTPSESLSRTLRAWLFFSVLMLWGAEIWIFFLRRPHVSWRQWLATATVEAAVFLIWYSIALPIHESLPNKPP
jgi:hypothetical protein